MNTKERIKELAICKHLTLAELERKLDISNGTIGKWDSRKPNSEPLEKVADYFNVSTDYLLGRTDDPSTTSSNDFDDVSVMFRMNTNDLSEKQKKQLKGELERFMKFAINELRNEE